MPPRKSQDPNDQAKAPVRAPRARVRKGGRPPKFGEPSRPVTLTLPNSVLEKLDALAEDRATAIVKIVGYKNDRTRANERMVRMEELGGGRAVIIVARSKALARIPFLTLVETTPGSFLLALDPGHDFKTLELAVRDELETLPARETRERQLLTELLECFSMARKGNQGITAGILLVGKGRTR